MSDRPDFSPEETEQIEEIVKRMLCKDLSLHVEEKRGSLTLQLQLGTTRVGRRFHISGRTHDTTVYMDLVRF